MILGILSDIHDSLQNLDLALTRFEKEGVTELIFCGDFCSPIPSRVLKTWKNSVHSVFGNGDGDRFAIRNVALTGEPNLILYGEYAQIEIGGKRIGITHYPFYARFMALSGEFDAVFSGHTHEKLFEKFGNTIWANPGDVMGWKNPASVGLYDTERHTFDFVTL